MTTLGFHVFHSAVGQLAITWSGAGVTRLRFVGGDGRVQIGSGCDEIELSDAARRVKASVLRLLAGEPADFPDSLFDFGDTPAFDQAVWRAILRIPPGRTQTYGEIAKAIGAAGEQRRVGQALGRNPIPVAVPCHRVLGADGKPGGFSAPGGLATKLELLNLERRLFGGGDGLFEDLPLAVRR